jgi:hypothetical protein
MKKMRQVSEAEAIGEFLRNEFYEPDYNHDRDHFESIVLNQDYSNPHENAIRRALLYRRRGHMMRELPSDTQWWQVELDAHDLAQVHVFPRAQWRKISNGSFRIGDVVERIRARNYRDGGDRVITKIQQIRYRLQSDMFTPSTVLLIGTDEHQPLTIFEGNHRLAAAMLVSPEILRTRFRILCGFSPRMTESCWYRTDVPNLWRYLKNRLTHIYDPDADVKRLLTNLPPAYSTKRQMAGAVATEKLREQS